MKIKAEKNSRKAKCCICWLFLGSIRLG